jgi:hypothetical protein
MCPFKAQTISTLTTGKTPLGLSCENIWSLRQMREQLFERCK